MYISMYISMVITLICHHHMASLCTSVWLSHSLCTGRTFAMDPTPGWCSSSSRTGHNIDDEWRHGDIDNEWRQTIFDFTAQGTTCEEKCASEQYCIGFWQYVAPSPNAGTCCMQFTQGTYSGSGYGLTYDRASNGFASSAADLIVSPISNCQCWRLVPGNNPTPTPTRIV